MPTRSPWTKQMALSLLLILILSLAAPACRQGGAGETSPTPSPVTIGLATNPEPPAIGRVELIINLEDTAGQPINNADVYVLVSHSDHSGMNMEGAATSQGNGRYSYNADLSMLGNWLITVEVRGVTQETIRQNFDLPLE